MFYLNKGDIEYCIAYSTLLDTVRMMSHWDEGPGAVQEGGAVGEEDAEQGGGEAAGHQPAPRHLQPQRGRGVRHQHAVPRHREPEPEQHQAAGSHSPGSVESAATGSPDEEGVVVVGGGAGGRRLQLLQLLDHKLRLNNQISHFMVVISRIPIISLC